MRAAPAVHVCVPRAGAWLGAIALLCGLAASALALWGLQQVDQPWAWPISMLVFGAAAAAGWRFAPVDSGRLAWNGRRWAFAESGGELLVMVDLGPWLLLRFDTLDTGRRAWLAVSARSAGTAWHGLRAAVYSRRPKNDADPDSEDPSATRM